MDLELRTCSAGLLLPVHAQPGARKARIVGLHGGRLKVAVTAPPENGHANRELIKLLAEALSLPRNVITLHAGTGNPRKVFLIVGFAEAELRARIEALLRG